MQADSGIASVSPAAKCSPHENQYCCSGCRVGCCCGSTNAHYNSLPLGSSQPDDNWQLPSCLCLPFGLVPMEATIGSYFISKNSFLLIPSGSPSGLSGRKRRLRLHRLPLPNCPAIILAKCPDIKTVPKHRLHTLRKRHVVQQYQDHVDWRILNSWPDQYMNVIRQYSDTR